MVRYRVWLSQHTYIIRFAENKDQARKLVWEEHLAHNAYKYGWTKADFLRNATVTEEKK